ncbi:acyl-CoA synthetase [Pilimelia anulata]|uniref:Acyl-CoA synthetase n=1 Tax=Pilimelia anulata TaxID=53371 RepID=A0A8J3B558_9ACTN|nr:AMP-binding protein [Pilimelia anulata]GGJ87576.1 acyl-CoA synthetase [Pilimelia anulata]
MLLSRLVAAPDERPDAVRLGPDAASAADLLARARAVAGLVAGAGRVAVEATPTLAALAAVVGTVLAGGAAVPVPPDAGPDERDHILRDSAADLLLTAAGSSMDTAVTPTAPMPAGRSDRALPALDPAGAALVLYTSGTTGPPKGAVLSRGALAACLDGLADAWAWTPDDLLVHGLPLFHVHGLVLGALGPLHVGSRLHHVGRPTPAAYAAAGGSLYFGVPTVWSRVAADPAAAAALAPARLLVSGSAALPVPVRERVAAASGHALVQRYGMTETLITISARADDPGDATTVGRPLPGVAARVVDPAGAPVPADGEAMGELHVRGATLFDGYLGRPDCRTPDGWFATGDIATVDPGGRYRIVGRASVDLIKSGGYRIGAGEVEDALRLHPAVREAAVVGTPHPDLGQQVTAYVVADPVSADELIAFVADRLARHKRPREVRFVADLPRTPLGKVRKSALT